ncbi:hypothetical protein [Mesorhizobium sp. 128a]
MTRLSFMMGLVLASSMARAGDIPYSPSADVPDYVAIMTVQPSAGSTGVHTRIVTHHGGWVRVDEMQATTYGNPANQISVTFGGDSQTGYSPVSISRETSTSYERIRGVIETGQTETHGGERCDVREILRRDPGTRNPGPQWLSCLTADGIEIATRVFVNGSPFLQATLVKLERRPVSAEEVALPANLLDVAQWLHFDDQPAATAVEQPPDFAIQMQWRGAVRVMRRHDPWIYDETSYPDGRRKLSIQNARTGQGLSFSAAKGGAFERLFLCRECRPGGLMSIVPGHGIVPESIGRTESILGEVCEWFDMAPRTFDINFSQCLTRDKIPLEIGIGGAWGAREEFVADEIQRRDLKTEEILPPSDVLKRSNWDIPDR